MKKNYILALIVFTASLFCLAASSPTVTDTLMRIQCDPASGSAQAFFEKATTIDDQIYVQPWQAVAWKIGSTRKITYTYDGEQYTQPYAQVLAAVQAIANQERVDPSP